MKRFTPFLTLAAFLGGGLTILAEEPASDGVQPLERPRVSVISPIHLAHGSHSLDAWNHGGGAGQDWARPFMAPGQSSIWMSAGSNGYLGAGFFTRQPFMIGETPFYYGVSVSREQGRDWFSGLKYRSNVVSPFVEWHGERTSVHLAFTAAETTFSGTPRAIVRPVSVSDAFPVRQRVLDERVDDRLSSRAVELNVNHRVFENLNISVSLQKEAHSLDRR